MGMYLDSMATYSNYKEAYNSPYFIDKTSFIHEIIPRIETTQKYICITRPRRFGKTIMANMIASFFSKGYDSKELFDRLEISKKEEYSKNINQYHVIFISFNKISSRCKNYEQYIERIEKYLKKDLLKTFPDLDIGFEDDICDIFDEIYELDSSNRFIFVFDEWDFIFHRDFPTEQDKNDYITFLSNLLKDKPYVALAYMTGILPIAKYSSGSELNMFSEYTMGSETMYNDYFGFTDKEVDELYKQYLKRVENPLITREGLKTWYDGYQTKSNTKVYNPRSVVVALTNNNLGNYWTSSGPNDEIFYYINHNVNEVRDDLALMVSGVPVLAKIKEYAAVSMNLTTKDEIFSAMLVYGFLTYSNGYVSIPNKELMDKFDEMLVKESSLGYIYHLAKESTKMLKATLSGDTKTMVKILEYAHNTESPLLQYNNEIELTAIINLVYLQARDFYRIEREDKAGIGYVDFIFYPEFDKSADCIILELKVNSTAKEALQQIQEKKYALKFEGKLGENPIYTGRVLGVGIAYDKENKIHKCEMEVLRDRL
jgi:hypothetical protein